MVPPDREAAAKRIQDLGPLDVAVYTDGSRLDAGAGYGFVVYRGRVKIAEGSGSAGEATDVYDAEVLGATEGLQAATAEDAPGVGHVRRIHIFLDNHAAAGTLAASRPIPHREAATDRFNRLRDRWESAPGVPPEQKREVRVHWIPGHKGIKGNEQADVLAKEGAAQPPAPISPSPAFLRGRIKTAVRQANTRAYEAAAPQRYVAHRGVK